MFYALQFGEKPPNDSIKPMRDRGADTRTHIFSNSKPNPNAAKMSATQDWAKQHVDPSAVAEIPAKGPPQREVSSALLLARQKRRELTEKPQFSVVAKEDAAAAVASTTVAALALKRAAAAAEAPFAREATTQLQTVTTSGGAYGAFAASQKPSPATLVTRDEDVSTTKLRVHDTVQAHQLLLPIQSSSDVVGVFPSTGLLQSTGPHQLGDSKDTVAAPLLLAKNSNQDDALRSMVERSMAEKPSSNTRQLHGLSPTPQSVVPNPPVPPVALTSKTLQAIGTWRYSLTPQTTLDPNQALLAARGEGKPLPSSAVTPRSQKSLPSASSAALPLHAPGPQVDWWVKSQAKYTGERKEAPTEDLNPGKINSDKDAATGANVGGKPDVPTGGVHVLSSGSSLQQQAATAILPPGAVLVVQPDGTLKLSLPTSTSVTLPQQQQQPQQTSADLTAVNAPAKPTTATTQGNGKWIMTNLVGQPPPATSRVKTTLPAAVSDVLRDAGVVQRVGGPPPTSIGRKTLDAIRAERDAMLKARWILEAPAREEALQRNVDRLVKAIRTSVEAKGFSEPTKGAQFIIKTCLQHSSSAREVMRYDEFKTIVEKGLNIPSLGEDVLSALFDRLDAVDERTVVPFRRFGELIFDLVSPSSQAAGPSVGLKGVKSGTKPQQQETNAALLKPAVRKILEDLKNKVAQRHGGTENWLLAFSSAFRSLSRLGGDEDTSIGHNQRTMNDRQLQAALNQLGLPISLRDASETVKAIDRDGDGVVDEDEFLYAMRGRMNRGRRALVLQAFDILDVDKSGDVTLQEISSRFDATQHPRVLSGEATPEQVLREFIALWNRDGLDDIVAWEDFLDYYKTISSAIENDAYFELMIRNCWHISGGSGAAQNTTCRRVLVIFKDGTQRVAEIENDLGIRAHETEKMIRILEGQGLTNIVRIQLYG